MATGGGCCRWTLSTTRRRRASARRVAGVGLGLGAAVFLMLLLLMPSSTDAFPFKRKKGTDGELQQQHQPGASSKGGKGKGGKRGKVKEDVAWLLEDTSDNGWKPVRDDGHVQVWKRSMPDSDFVAIKSKASLSVSPQALFEVLTPGDIEIVRQYNPLVEDGSDLEVMDRDNKVSWSATMGVWPCRPRDFVTHIRRATLDDGSVAIVNSATTHPNAPAKGKYVRGEILHGVFHIKAAKNKKHSEFTMVHHFNPGGNIPPWLINWLAEGKPITFVRKLEEVAMKWDKQAAQTKSMPCKGRGFADKPCAFLLSPAEDGQGSGGVGSGAPVASGGWSAFRTTLTMAALACCGWVVCFGWPPILLKEEGAAPPPTATATAPVKVPRGGENGTLVDAADVANAAPATHGAPEANPPPDLPSSAQEVGKEKDDVVLVEQAVKEATSESLKEGKAKAKGLEIPNGEVRDGEEVSTAAESGEDTSAGELTCGESVSGEKEEPLTPPPAIATAIALADEVSEEENGDFAGADIVPAVSAAREELQTAVGEEEQVARKELDTAGQFPSAEENGGDLDCCRGTTAPEPSSEEGVGGVEVTVAGEALSNGDVCSGEVRGGTVAGLEVASEQLPSEEGPHGEALAPLDPLFTFGDKPLKE